MKERKKQSIVLAINFPPGCYIIGISRAQSHSQPVVPRGVAVLGFWIGPVHIGGLPGLGRVVSVSPIIGGWADDRCDWCLGEAKSSLRFLGSGWVREAGRRERATEGPSKVQPNSQVTSLRRVGRVGLDSYQHTQAWFPSHMQAMFVRVCECECAGRNTKPCQHVQSVHLQGVVLSPQDPC